MFKKFKKFKRPLDQAYFEAGRDWYFDRYQSLEVISNRWFVAFLGASALAILLVIAVTILMPLKTLVPLVIHQNATTGETWVEKPDTHYTPDTQAETNADIVRYIVARESYLSQDINQRFNEVMLLSDGTVGKRYADQQSNDNKQSPVNKYGNDGMRTVHIEDIVYLDRADAQELRHFRQAPVNLAKVDFTTTSIDPNGNKSTKPWVATISWIYKGTPDTEQAAWDNWNGFTVIAYRVDPRNIGGGGHV